MNHTLPAIVLTCGLFVGEFVQADEPVPLSMLGSSTYEGKQGGLWPEGANAPPAAQIEALRQATARIVPRDAEGRPSDDGRIGFLAVGASTGRQMMAGMIAAATNDSTLNSRVTLVNGCVGGADVNKILDDRYWMRLTQSLAESGLDARQVQAAWLQTDDLRDQEADFPGRPERYKERLVELCRLVKQKFPNLQVFYLLDRHTTAFGQGDATKTKHGEPRPYYVGWANKWLIADQLAGRAELRWDGDAAPAPLLTWGPYLWTVADRPRADGYRWTSDMVVPDGVHLSEAGQERMGRELIDFFAHDPFAKLWFLGSSTTAQSVAAAPAKKSNDDASHRVAPPGDVTKRPKQAGTDDPAWWVNGINKMPKVARLVDPHTTVKAVFKDADGRVITELDDVLRRHTDLNKLLGPGAYGVDFYDTAGMKITLTLEVDTIFELR